jgi:hypothetical protein
MTVLLFEVICERVKRGESPPYRPIIGAVKVFDKPYYELMTKCWSERSEKRPAFRWTTRRLKRIAKRKQAKNLCLNTQVAADSWVSITE